MSGNFFKKTKIDTDEIASIASDLEDLASAADTFKDEIDSYKDELETLHRDLEDCDDADDLKKVISALRDVCVPDGYDNPDGSPDGIADALEELDCDKSEYDEWQENVQDGISNLQNAITRVASGRLLPTQRAGAYAVDKEDLSKPRIVRPGQVQDQMTNLPYSSETDAWSKALLSLCKRTAEAKYEASEEFTRNTCANEMYTTLRNAIVECMTYRHASGTPVPPANEPVLAMMWFVDDLLQEVAKAMGINSRVVLTTAQEMLAMHRVADNLRKTVGDGFEKIDESVNANS